MNYTEFVEKVFNIIKEKVDYSNKEFNNHYNVVLYPWFSEGKVISISWEEDDDDYKDDWECGLTEYLIKDNCDDTYEIRCNSSQYGVYSLGNFNDVDSATKEIIQDYDEF